MTIVSLSKLDLSFLKKPAAVKAGRWVYDEKKGELIPVSKHYRAKARAAAKKRGTVATPYFMPDVDAAYGGAWKSIIDGSEISSRPNWREHNKRNGVAQVDGDYWGKSDDHFVSEIKARMEFDEPVTSNDSVFSWKAPESAKARKNVGQTGRGRARKPAE